MKTQKQLARFAKLLNAKKAKSYEAGTLLSRVADILRRKTGKNWGRYGSHVGLPSMEGDYILGHTNWGSPRPAVFRVIAR